MQKSFKVYLMCFPFLQRFPCSMCWMPGLHSVMSINAVLRRRRSQHQQLHQHPQEKMKKLQVEMRPAQPPILTAHHIFVITDPVFLFLFPFLPPALPLFSVCPSVFEVPASYHRRGGSRHAPASNNDEELLQYAIHQSLLESRRAAGQVRTIEGKSVTFWTSTLYLNMLVCKWLIGHWILLLVMTSVLICPLISSTHPNLHRVLLFFILQVAASLTRSLLYVCVVAGGELGWCRWGIPRCNAQQPEWQVGAQVAVTKLRVVKGTVFTARLYYRD